jgi:hygromycin-B 4-O-kinase
VHVKKELFMPDLRPAVDSEQVLVLLKQQFSEPITDFAPLEGGQVARTFAFRAGSREYIVRFNKDNMLTSNFPKEAYVYQKLAATSIPMPPIIQVGRLDGLHFAISQRAPGKMLEQHSPQEVAQLLPQLIKTLDAIHQIDVSDTQGYGVFDFRGKGMSSSWSSSLLQVDKEEDESDYFGKWHHLFDDTFLERDLYRDLYERMKSLLTYCPEERYLLHGNYSLRNVLGQDGKITAVIDWIDAQYGDFVYDIAIFGFWTGWMHVSERFQQYYQEQQREIPFYAERLLCYQCYHALGGLRFFAAKGDEQAYQWTRGLIQHKLDAFVG